MPINRLSDLPIISLVVLFDIVVYGQQSDSDKTKISQTTKEIQDIKVIITQYKSMMNLPQMPYCVADIMILKNDILIDSIKFNDIDAVGGHYGLLVYPELVKNHILISKYGDYKGETILINDKGEKFITIGGYSYLDNKSGLLFSIWDSDLSGFSVFDLTTDTEIYKITDIEERLQEFYNAFNDKYFYRAINDITGQETIWVIEFNLDRVMKVDLELSDIKSGRLRNLTDYDKIIIECE